jgi:hypothetical protein
MAALTRLPAVPCLSYGNAADLERQLCEFILRGIGLTKPQLPLIWIANCRRIRDNPVTAESA